MLKKLVRMMVRLREEMILYVEDHFVLEDLLVRIKPCCHHHVEEWGQSEDSEGSIVDQRVIHWRPLV